MFAPLGKYEPCGMFSIEHIISIIICFISIFILVFKTHKCNKNKIEKVIKIITIIITILELIKIGYNHINGYKEINNWVPLHFCSLFIYSLWMVGYGKGVIKKIGESFLCSAGILAGGGFLIMPSSSLTLYPIFHFQCLYSLLFHSMMLYFGLLYFINNWFILNCKNHKFYYIFCTAFCLIAFLLNTTTDANFMFMDNPWNIPIRLLVDVHKKIPLLYTLIIYVVYSIVIYFVMLLIQKIIIKVREKNELL